MEKKIDGAKLQALLDNEELMSKLSAEGATAKDYVEVFKTSGIELTEEEAQQLKEEVAKIVADPEKALNDEELRNISGGLSFPKVPADKETADVYRYMTYATTGGGALVGVGCLIASRVVKDSKYKERLRNVGLASLTAASAGAVGYLHGGVVGAVEPTRFVEQDN